MNMYTLYGLYKMYLYVCVYIYNILYIIQYIYTILYYIYTIYTYILYYIYRAFYNECKKLGGLVLEVILSKKCLMNIGSILMNYRTTTDQGFIYIIQKHLYLLKTRKKIK